MIVKTEGISNLLEVQSVMVAAIGDPKVSLDMLLLGNIYASPASLPRNFLKKIKGSNSSFTHTQVAPQLFIHGRFQYIF